MTVRYKKIQNKIPSSKSYGKWYGRTVSMGTVTTRQLAEEISHSTTVTRGDIMAVLIELATVVRNHLLNSETVKIDEIGSFRVGMTTLSTSEKKDFDTSKIKSFRILYRPESTRSSVVVDDKAGTTRAIYTKSLLNGIEVEELTTDGAKTSTGGSSSDSGSSSASGSDSGSGSSSGSGSDSGSGSGSSDSGGANL